jgi:hypothetical protein
MAELLSWTVHRATESPAKTAAAAAFILAFVAFSWLVFGPVLGVLAVVVLFLALNTYFLPVTYTFTDKGIEVDKRLFTVRYDWKQFRRWFRTTGGIVVSPFSHVSYLDNFRGVHLMLPTERGQTPTAERRTSGGVDTAAIVAYLEKQFEPPLADDRLGLDEPSDITSQGSDFGSAGGEDGPHTS